MELSRNSDIKLGSDSYHIQTEDWGMASPFIVSRVFKNGAVVRSIKTPYTELIEAPMWDKTAVEKAVEYQHNQILDLLISGHPL
ncbi:MAG: hypothetical protein H6623_09540 [Bdellovibrionaceae bacterium]|nr:hypothetical protein [Pseudobdellovibrionaceae bacterium]